MCLTPVKTRHPLPPSTPDPPPHSTPYRPIRAIRVFARNHSALRCMRELLPHLFSSCYSSSPSRVSCSAVYKEIVYASCRLLDRVLFLPCPALPLRPKSPMCPGALAEAFALHFISRFIWLLARCGPRQTRWLHSTVRSSRELQQCDYGVKFATSVT